MNRLLTLALISVCAPFTAAAPDQSINHHAPSAYEAQLPRLILLQTPREGVLQNRSPYRSAVRSYTNNRGGNAYDTRSGLPYGASPNAAHDLVIVRPREAVPYIAISPWEPITDRTIDELERNYPWLRRTDSIRNDLVVARNQYLRERGYVGTVRGFRNQSPRVNDASHASHSQQVFWATPGQSQPSVRAESPQLVILEGDTDAAEQLVTERLKPESVIRRSEPGGE